MRVLLSVSLYTTVSIRRTNLPVRDCPLLFSLDTPLRRYVLVPQLHSRWLYVRPSPLYIRSFHSKLSNLCCIHRWIIMLLRFTLFRSATPRLLCLVEINYKRHMNIDAVSSLFIWSNEEISRLRRMEISETLWTRLAEYSLLVKVSHLR